MRTHCRRFALCSVASGLLALAGVAESQEVHVVDSRNRPGAEFLTIQSAIDAAEDGDIVFIKRGNGYKTETLIIDQKSIVIHAIAGASIELHAVHIQNIRSDQTVVVAGLAMDIPSLIYYCDGPVWFQDCVFRKAFSGSSSPPMRVVSSELAMFRDCLMPDDLAANSAASLIVQGSNVYLYGSDVSGQSGFHSTYAGLGLPNGTTGIEYVSSQVWFYGATVTGGMGADANLIPSAGCFAGGAGGDAVVATANWLPYGRSELYDLGAVITGGMGGPGQPCGVSGPNGQDFVDRFTGNVHATILQAARYETLSSPVRENGSITATQRGVAGDAIWTYYSDTVRAPLFGTKWDGGFFIGGPAVGFPNGTIPAGGVLSRSFSLGAFPPGVEGVGVFAQSVMRDAATGRFVASAPTYALFLDEGI